jgi:N4-gp56 family major capsid protein
MPGSSVVFSVHQDLATATSSLTETSDTTAVALSDVNTVTVTLAEKGNTVTSTRKLSELAFSDVDPAVVDIVAYNMLDSLDELVQTTLRGGTNVIYGGSSNAATADVAAGDNITGAIARKVTAYMRGGKAIPREGGLFHAFAHPYVTHDLRAETGALAFEDINKYTASEQLKSLVTGVLGGAYWIETPRAYNATDGTSSARVYRTTIVGKQALAEAVAIEPGVVMGPITDNLMRFRPVSWYGILGHAVFRETSLYRVETTSSI